MNTNSGRKTWLDIGINVDQSKVTRAYVNGPDGFVYEFQGIDWYGDGYFRELDGPPALGDYTFTVELNDGTSQSSTDTQDTVELLPIIRDSEIEIIGEDGVIPYVQMAGGGWQSSFLSFKDL